MGELPQFSDNRHPPQQGVTVAGQDRTEQRTHCIDLRETLTSRFAEPTENPIHSQYPADRLLGTLGTEHGLEREPITEPLLAIRPEPTEIIAPFDGQGESTTGADPEQEAAEQAYAELLRMVEIYDPLAAVETLSTGSQEDKEAQKALIAGSGMSPLQAVHYSKQQVEAHHTGNPYQYQRSHQLLHERI